MPVLAELQITAGYYLVLAALMAGSVHAAEAAAPFKPDLARGQAIAVTCGACHTNDGTRGLATYPILQGQHPEYLVKQLTEFKANKRVNAIMNGMAAPLTEADMKNVAAFYASKKPVPGAAKNKDTVALGEKIYRGGIAERKVPACAGCHGPSGRSPGAIPSIYGRTAPAIADAFKARFGHQIHNIYGLTETYGPATICAKHEEWDQLALPDRARLNGRQGVRFQLQEGMTVIDPETMTEVPADGETIAMRAAGLGLRSVLGPMAWFSVLAAVATLFLSMTARPWRCR